MRLSVDFLYKRGPYGLRPARGMARDTSAGILTKDKPHPLKGERKTASISRVLKEDLAQEESSLKLGRNLSWTRKL